MPSRKQSGSEATREPRAKPRRGRQARRATPAAARKRAPKAVLPGYRRVRIDHAMRAIGLDESRLAENYSRLLHRVDKPKNEKLHLETLKECGKLLDAYPGASHGSAGSDAVPVQLVHSVPRPVRPATSFEGKEAG